MDLGMGSWRFIAVSLLVISALDFYHARTAPYYGFVQESIKAPPASYLYDYIIIGGGTTGCPLAATLSESAKVLVLERGGSPYVNNAGKTDRVNFFPTLLDSSPDSYAQPFVSEDGVYNHRARVLGGGSVFNAGVYSHAETEFIEEAGLDEALVNDSYRWVERKVVFEPSVMQWQSAVRDGLLESGVTPYNGFTYDHINGTKIGATIFDNDGHRHSAADLLDYANPKNIQIYLHATVLEILWTTENGLRPRAKGVIFEDAIGVKHRAFLANNSKSEMILSAGAIGSPQLLMLSGIGPAQQLQNLGINVVMDQPMVGQDMADNPLNGLVIPSNINQFVEVSLVSIVGITPSGNYIEAGSGLNLLPSWTNWLSKTLPTINLNLSDGIFDSLSLRLKGGIIIEKVKGPISKGYLQLRSKNPKDTPKVRFNYFQSQEDLQKCVKGMETIIKVVNSKAFSKFRNKLISTQALLNLVAALPLNLRPRHLDTALSLEQYCKDTVMTLWHYHGGCHVGKVVDSDFRVIGVDRLRVIDASTFNISPGTNPQATIMMLGRYMGIRIQQERL